MKEYIIGNAIVEVSRPELTEAEQAKRKGVILTALQQYGKAMANAERTVGRCLQQSQ